MMKPKQGPLQVSFSELTYDDNSHPRVKRNFKSCIGTISSITCQREDDQWKIAVRRLQRRKERVFLCAIGELEEERAMGMMNKRVLISPETITVL